MKQVLEALMKPRNDISIPNGDKDGQGRMVEVFAEFLMPFRMCILPPFPNFERGRFLALGCDRLVASIAAVPSKFMCGFDGQVKGVVVGSLHQNHLCAEDQQLCHLRWWGRFWSEDHGFLSHGSRHPCERCARVPSGGSHDHFRADL